MALAAEDAWVIVGEYHVLIDATMATAKKHIYRHRGYNRKNYVRLQSGHSRLCLGHGHYRAFWRINDVPWRPSGTLRRAEDRANTFMARVYHKLWVVDARVFHQSPFLPKSRQPLE